MSGVWEAEMPNLVRQTAACLAEFRLMRAAEAGRRLLERAAEAGRRALPPPGG